MRDALDGGGALARGAATRATLWTDDDGDTAGGTKGSGTLWVDGSAIAVGGAAWRAAAAIARRRSHAAGGALDTALDDPAAQRLVVHLIREGLLHVESDVEALDDDQVALDPSATTSI